MSDKKNHLKTVSTVVLLTLIGKVLGLVRDLMLGHNFGTGMESTAFLTASRIPRIFFDAIFASAISSSFIPVFNEYLKKRGKDEAFRLSSSFISWMTLLTALLTGIGILFAPQITAVLADGFDAQTAALCTSLLRLLFPTILFTAIAFSFVGVLQSLGEFNIPALLSAVSNGVILIYYFFFCGRFGVFGLTIAFLIGWAMQAIIQIPSLHRFGYHYKPILYHEGLHKIFVLMLPVMVSTWIQPVNLAVSTRYASHIFEGAGVSAIEYANTLYTMIVGILVLSVANVIFPELSRLTADEHREEFGAIVGTTLRSLLFLLLPLMIGLMALAKPIIKLLYEWKAWDSFSTDITARALFFLSLGMVGYGIQNILSRAFYAVQNGKIPLITGSISILVNLVLCAILSSRFDVAGLAFASTVSSTVSAVLLLGPMNRRYPGMLTPSFFRDLLRMSFCALLMGGGVYSARFLLSGVLADSMLARFLIVVIPTALGILLYLLLAAITHVPEMQQVSAILKKIGHKGGH